MRSLWGLDSWLSVALVPASRPAPESAPTAGISVPAPLNRVAPTPSRDARINPSVGEGASPMLMPATHPIPLFRNILHIPEDRLPFFFTEHLIDGRIEHALLLHVVRAEKILQRRFLLIAVGILFRHLVMNGFELLPDQAMFVP